MHIPTEPIGSIPRPLRLIEAVTRGDADSPALEAMYDEAIRDTIARFEETGSPVITDGEQRKYHNFWTYCVHGLPNTAPEIYRNSPPESFDLAPTAQWPGCTNVLPRSRSWKASMSGGSGFFATSRNSGAARMPCARRPACWNCSTRLAPS